MSFRIFDLYWEVTIICEILLRLSFFVSFFLSVLCLCFSTTEKMKPWCVIQLNAWLRSAVVLPNFQSKGCRNDSSNIQMIFTFLTKQCGFTPSSKKSSWELWKFMSLNIVKKTNSCTFRPMRNLLLVPKPLLKIESCQLIPWWKN